MSGWTLADVSALPEDIYTVIVEEMTKQAKT
jgi:hypothetical protein